MTMRRVLTAAFFVIAALAVSAKPASADVQSVYHGGTYFGSVVVEPDQVVKGDLTVVGGDATIEGVVDGNVDVVGGNLDERPGATITGQVTTVGGDMTGTLVPWTEAVPVREVPRHNYRILWWVAWDVVAVLFFLVFPVRTRMALDRLERHPGMCAAFGLVGWVAVWPLAILLFCTILLIPFIAVEAVLVIAAVFLGKAALALLVGRRLCEVVSPSTTPAPIVALIVGLILITAAELVPVLGIIVTAFVLLIGLGASILAFTGDTMFGPAAPASSQPPLSGPPMPAA